MTAPRRVRRVARLSRLLFTVPLWLGLSAAPALAQCPVAAGCTPGAASDPNAQFFGMGIYRVTFGSINNVTQGYTDGYRDYSCAIGTTLTAGATYTMSVQTGSLAQENVRVWIDWDNNGLFNATTELFFSSNSAQTHSGTGLRVPATATLGTPLRMRVSADANTSPIPSSCSTPQFSQVEDYAVTVQGNTQPPTAAFTVSDTLTCSGLVQFTDQSTNAPASWLWRFGDGTTSTQQNPQHQYNAQGRYTVTLRVTNANGIDSLRRTNYIRYDNVVPVAASCTPQTAAYCCGYGIARVRFATIDRSSGNGSEGYSDFTCGSRATVYPGNDYTLTVNPSSTTATDIRAWLDWNNDGVFSSNEQVMTALAQTAAATVRITIPATATLNQPMRLRIIADAVGQTSGPCVAPQLGQAEDYTVVVRANTQPPVAAFSLSQPSVCDTTIQFTDLSQNTPTAWKWYFGDGGTSTLQNPSHTYHAGGSYTVTLVARNAFGVDSLVHTNAVSVTLPCIIYCEPTNLQTQSVWINRVQLANVDRNSGLDSAGYVNTGLVANLTQGIPETLQVSVTINGGGGPPQFISSAWIDWNHNGVWETSERVLQGQGNPQMGTVQAVINVPNTAPLGLTRMRVLATRNQQLANNPCPPDQAPGIEIEDYNILIAPSQAPPVAAFSLDPRVTCDGLVQFTDSSSNSPTSWRWTFGDGSAPSTLRNPQHQFPTTGAATYTVKMVATNQYGTDSVVRLNIVRVTGYPQPIAPSCRPNSISPGFGLGIGVVRLVSANTTMANASNNGSDGYKDYSCQKQTNIYRNAPATLTVTTIQNTPAHLRAWLDYNDDGVFDEATETVMSITRTAGGAGPYVATFTPPATAPVINTRLRLRIASDWSGNNNPAPTPCSQPQYGQVEDYSVQIRDTVLATPDAYAPLALALAPNPTADGRVALRLTGDRPGAEGALLTVTVRSVLGQVVARRTLTVQQAREAELDLSALPRGVYIVNTNGPTPALTGNLRLVRD